MTAYYNEIDPFSAQWLRNLIAGGLIAPGEVDERSIEDVQPGDLVGFTQCHFFAGVGVWSYALRSAGWPDDRPDWTGSCPCQPFSAAGKRKGTADERHLWPAWFHLIEQCRPSVIFGEQVASGDGMSWLDLVQADLEGLGYACGPVVTPAAGYGAPHQRHRLYFVADAERHGGGTDEPGRDAQGRATDGRDGKIVFVADAGRCGCGSGITSEPGQEGGATLPCDGIESCILADPQGERQRPGEPQGDHRDRFFMEGSETGSDGQHDSPACILADDRGSRRDTEIAGSAGEKGIEKPDGNDAAGRGCMGDAFDKGLEGHTGDVDRGDKPGRIGADEAGYVTEASGPCNGFWRDAVWLPCRDGKARPAQSRIFPLAHGAAGRVGRLRAYGNCLVAPQATEFIRAYMDKVKP